MPYITKEARKRIDRAVERAILQGIEANGELNYFLFKLCKWIVKPSYNNYKNYIGELNECIAEIRRRIIAPYEDEKIEENGDIE